MIIFILSFLHATDAQWKNPWYYDTDVEWKPWYYKACGVIDINNTTSEEFECLWNKSAKTFRGGAIATAIGTSSIIVSLIIFSGSSFYSDSFNGALILLIGGIIIDIIGIPNWIIGAVRKSQLKKLRTTI